MDELKQLLSDFPTQAVNAYVLYVKKLQSEPWAKSLTPKMWAHFYKQVHAEGLVLDGKHITVQSTGVTYDYVAYKNKMLLVYEDSIIDAQVVYEGDTFNFEKVDGSVRYTHTFANPFENDEAKIIGVYCVIKNARGEFLTTLSRKEIDKHRQVARTKMIWDKWYKEMALKTVIKKACKAHFDDIYEKMEEEDNKSIDLDLVNAPDELAEKIQAVSTLEELRTLYAEHSGKGKEVVALFTKRKAEITNPEANA